MLTLVQDQFDVVGAFHFAHREMAREQVSPVDLGKRQIFELSPKF